MSSSLVEVEVKWREPPAPLALTLYCMHGTPIRNYTMHMRRLCPSPSPSGDSGMHVCMYIIYSSFFDSGCLFVPAKLGGHIVLKLDGCNILSS